MKFIAYFFSAVSIVLSNPCIGPSSRIKIFFFLLSTLQKNSLLIRRTPKIITLQPNPPVGNEEVPYLSNEIPYPEYCIVCLNQQQQFSVFLHIFHLFQLLEKLKIVPVDLSKLNNIVNQEVVKKTVYDKLVAKVNDIDTSGFVLKTKYDTDKSDLK